MSVIHRRLFWKIYLTLLSSLLVVAVLMGGLWWMLGTSPHERWGAFRVHLADKLVTEQVSPPNALNDTIRRLGDEIGTDISLYGADGALLASGGSRKGPADANADSRPPVFMRIDLPDGRTVMVRLQHTAGQRAQAILLAMLVAAGGVGLAAFPMTARLTRQLETLRTGMARWGQGEVRLRVDETGSDEVAAVARTFNAAAARIDALLTSQRTLLANASHELRSPLARLRIAIDLWLDNPAEIRRDEIVRNLAELDGLVEEILLCSRLTHPSSAFGRVDCVDLLGLAAEEAARAGATLEGEPVDVHGDETLLRRLIRNLLANGFEHGQPPVRIAVRRLDEDTAQLVVTDDGEGVPAGERERVFEAFYRPGGRAESGGGWGLGLSLVRQIAVRHGGTVTCEADSVGRFSRFVVTLAIAAAPRPDAVPGPAPAARTRQPLLQS